MRCLCTRSRTYHCKVVLLDEQELLQEIQDTSIGQHVLDTVFRHLNLIETAYFGLRYVDCNNQTHWLDSTKKVAKQLKGKDSFTLYFGVKFYAVDPCKLVEEITRYQFFLQIKQDILQGRLPVSFDLASELGAYAVQSELGDYDPRRHSKGYVTEFRFVSNQTVELENKIAELHKDLQGQLPAVAELNYLDKVKWLEMYGVDLHTVIGEDNVEYFLGLTPTGVIVLRNKNKVANYYWPTITKIYFKGKYFMLRVCDKNNEENTYGFETPSRPACKHLYKCCFEHHSFFRLVNVTSNPPDVVNTRFSGNRADKLSVRSSQISMRNPPLFTRTPSRRYQRRIVEGAQDSPKVDEKNIFKENISDTGNHISGSGGGAVNNSFYMNRSDSPRSTRSAPWGAWSNNTGQTRTYSSHSPRSVRSAGPGPPLRLSHARRSSSVESQSSNESRPCRRHKHRSKRGSDNESDMSKCSSHGNRRHRHRSRRSSGSEHEHHHSSSRYQLVESQGQWREVQKRQAEGSSGVHQANVVRPRSGYINSGIETESEVSSCHHHHRRKHRKHRSRSRSPSDGGGGGGGGGKPRLPEELKKHLEFQLVETDGMSEDQLREIPYTIVKTNSAKAIRVRLSPSDRPKPHHSARRTKSCLLKDGTTGSSADSPPPPYSESPVLSDLSNKTTSTSTSTTAGTTISNSSVKQNSSSQISRLSSSQSGFVGADNYLSNQKLLASSSALYGNPSTLLAYPPLVNGGQQSSAFYRKDGSLDNSVWLNDAIELPNSSLVVGLPPQPHSRKSCGTSYSDTSLNSIRSHNNPKARTSSEIRGNLPWTLITDHLQNPQSNNIYSCLDNPRRGNATQHFGNERANINQNILEHRCSTTSQNNGNNVVTGNNSALSNNNSNSAASVHHQQNRLSSSSEFDKFKKSALAETGVLGSHCSTSNGTTVAWPNEKQFGWHPKMPNKFTKSAGVAYNPDNDNYKAQQSNGSVESPSRIDVDNRSLPQNTNAVPWQSEKGPLIYSPSSAQVPMRNEKITSSNKHTGSNDWDPAAIDRNGNSAVETFLPSANANANSAKLLPCYNNAGNLRVVGSVNKNLKNGPSSNDLSKTDNHNNTIEQLIQEISTEL